MSSNDNTQNENNTQAKFHGTQGELNENNDLQESDGKNIENSASKTDRKTIIASKVKGFAHRIANAFRLALYPEDITCDICGGELTANTRYRICASCIEKLPFVKGHRCVACGVPLSDEADYCNRCKDTQAVFVKNRSPLVYEGETKKLMYALKFGKKKYIAYTLGALMADEFLKCDMRADIVVFVPMTDAEKKKRGFNQSELLANEVGARLNLPVLPALVKTRQTSAQKQLKGKDRATNLEGAFACVFDEVKNRSILLIDDIFTTGATANECSKVLLKSKAREVNVLTAAVTKLKTTVESNDGTTQI